MITKVCRGCGREFGLDRFYRNRRLIGGYKNQCKDCCKVTAIVSRLRWADRREAIKRHLVEAINNGKG